MEYNIEVELEVTQEEQNAIRTLQRPAKRWPKSLWLFAASHDLWVMKLSPASERYVVATHGGMDSDAIVAHIRGIHSDGGDW